ncbi:MAG: penicillin-insensitive murein endopeptidase [Deltaproteobacteria bacterium]|nr:penicillin-insensitive murein endopeptidase [Deltaproteobacteria bacterium]
MRAALVVAAAFVSGCLPWRGATPGVEGSVGLVQHGFDASSELLPRKGQGYLAYHADAARYGAPQLVRLLKRVAARVAAARPGATTLVGDLSAPCGGFIAGHRSHRSGRDADLGFFTTDRRGRSTSSRPGARFDRFGVGERDGEVLRFDTDRNWLLVEALLDDPEARVQWIFVSRGLKALLIAWALAHGRDLGLVERAASVLHQPEGSPPHDDHFHVRVYCPQDAAACVDDGPVWSWVEGERRQGRAPGDAELLGWAFEGLR